MLSLNKYLKTSKLLIVVCLFLFKNNILSQNLIQNGSFEYYNGSNCVGNFSIINNWSYLVSPDYFSSDCTTGAYKIPDNNFGVSYPKNGNAYIGLGLINLPYETKEYICQYLTSPLISGKTYYTSFFLSKSDRTRIATEKIGAYFSMMPPVAPGNTYVAANPQVENHSGFLTDTVNWVKIDGYFTAQGGEQYMTIGNFNSNANTDTLYTGTTNPFFADAGTAYYYIDSVSLYDSLDYVSNIKEHQENLKINAFPNPNDGNFNIEYHTNKEAEFVMTDITGRLVIQYDLFPSQNSLLIKEEELNAGVYFYHIRQGNHLLKQDKIIVIK